MGKGMTTVTLVEYKTIVVRKKMTDNSYHSGSISKLKARENSNSSESKDESNKKITRMDAEVLDNVVREAGQHHSL